VVAPKAADPFVVITATAPLKAEPVTAAISAIIPSAAAVQSSVDIKSSNVEYGEKKSESEEKMSAQIQLE